MNYKVKMEIGVYDDQDKDLTYYLWECQYETEIEARKVFEALYGSYTTMRYLGAMYFHSIKAEINQKDKDCFWHKIEEMNG